MNTVDALKDLYKTLCGKDYAGDPNPTDAEMISAIAKDASTGGGGSDGGGDSASKVIFLTEEINESQTAGRLVGTTIAPNLTLEDLAGYLWYIEAGGMWMQNPIMIPQSQTTEGKIIVNVTIPSSGIPSHVPIPYDIATGEIATEWSD